MTHGSCHCGAIQYEIDTAHLLRFAHCHCPDCRKLSGTICSSAMVMRDAGFRLISGADNLSSYESSTGKTRYFCRTCGAPMHSVSAAMPGIVIVRAGSLDADPGVRPQFHIWVSAKAPWHEIRDGLPQHPEWPPKA